MVQTFGFMSKNYKHVLIQKVTFSTKKELLTQPYTRKPRINAQNLYVDQSNNVVFPHPDLLEYTETFLCPHSVFHLQQSSLDWLNYLSCLL